MSGPKGCPHPWLHHLKSYVDKSATFQPTKICLPSKTTSLPTDTRALRELQPRQLSVICPFILGFSVAFRSKLLYPYHAYTLAIPHKNCFLEWTILHNFSKKLQIFKEDQCDFLPSPTHTLFTKKLLRNFDFCSNSCTVFIGHMTVIWFHHQAKFCCFYKILYLSVHFSSAGSMTIPISKVLITSLPKRTILQNKQLLC